MGVGHDEIGQNHVQAALAHLFAEGVIIGELVLDHREASDGLQRDATQRDGRADARPRHVQGHARHDIGQEAVIDAHRAQTSPTGPQGACRDRGR